MGVNAARPPAIAAVLFTDQLSAEHVVIVWLVAVGLFFLLYNTVLVGLAERLQRAILDSRKGRGNLVEAGRASWTNIGIVAALGLTIAGAMVQAEPIAEPLSMAGQLYVYCTWIAYGMCLQACIQASLAVIYTDVLTEEQMALLLEQKPSMLTRPLLVFIFAFMHVGLGLVLHMADVYGPIAGAFILGLYPLTYWGIYSFWQELDDVSHVGNGSSEASQRSRSCGGAVSSAGYKPLRE